MTTKNADYSKYFWVSCRKCKHKFGVPPKYVMLYVERIMREYGEKDADVAAALEEAQDGMENGK